MNILKINSFMMVVVSIFLMLNPNVKAQQSFICTVDTNIIVDTLGSEMIFYFHIKNISSNDLTVYILRSENNLPQGWQSSLCLIEYCYSPELDSIVTNRDFGSEPIPPDSTREGSLHVKSDTTDGTGHVHLIIGDFNNPTDSVGFEFTASTVPLSVLTYNYTPDQFSLKQNYPNPFNPSTQIEYSLAGSGHVTLKVFDILGRLVSKVVDANKNAGSYKVSFNASNLPSGVYIYRLQTKNYSRSRKMLLLK
jgi:Secretion system C-terminal sorting domain